MYLITIKNYDFIVFFQAKLLGVPYTKNLGVISRLRVSDECYELGSIPRSHSLDLSVNHSLIWRFMLGTYGTLTLLLVRNKLQILC